MQTQPKPVTDVLMERMDQVKAWWGRGKFAPQINPYDVDLKREAALFCVYTERYIYHFTVKDQYLGCIASSRKAEMGEDWTRGMDLSDGKFSEETWNKIMADIVSAECVGVVGSIKRVGG
jgi:hypothetical protein